MDAETAKLTFDSIHQAEILAIDRRRERLKRPLVSRLGPEQRAKPMYDTAGIALSGGGIRSAAFCLGVLQALENRKLLDRFDYLSTVSGGGYAGAMTSADLTRNKGVFSFVADEEEKQDTEAMRRVRDGSNYLVPGGVRDLLLNAGILLRGIAANVLMVASIPFLMAAFMLWLKPDGLSLGRETELPFGLAAVHRELGPFGFSIASALLVSALLGLWALMRGARHQNGGEIGSPIARAAWPLLLAPPIVFAIELQPYAVKQVFVSFVAKSETTSLSFNAILAALATAAAPITGVVAFFSKYLGDFMKSSESTKSWTVAMQRLFARLAIWAAAFALPFLIWVAFLYLVYLGHVATAPDNVPPAWVRAMAWLPTRVHAIAPHLGAYIAIGYLSVLSWVLLGPNGNSLHRLYRDRLSETFVEFKAGVEPDARPAQPLKLSEIDTDHAPFHLINCALNIQGSDFANKRGRNADFFHFSSDFAGSEATGYVDIAKLEACGRSFDLASAMAISGAAISSNMGSQSIRWLSIPLALLNLRLGYWMPNPRHIAAGKRRPWPALYFLMEAFSLLNEKREEIYLTDGGHVENLGLYELLRRRCKLILVVDAEADPEMRFPSFVRLQRYARIDLGVRIFTPLARLRDTLKRTPDEPQKGAHCAVGRIEYGAGQEGILIYVKASLTGDENDYVLDYARRYPAFPHETTGDQFFSEEQFEVYRVLGFHAINGVLDGRRGVEQDGAGEANLTRALPADTLLRKAAQILFGR